MYKLQTISVALQKRSYPIWIENGLLTKLPELLKPMNQGQKWVVFSQSEIFNLYGNKLIDDLNSSGFQVEKVILLDGERAKSLSTLEDVYSQLIELGCHRSSTFIALGGGVAGDAAGYIAATFMRGVDYIQIPSTLLAMVDSSIGGKTGVNLLAGKNLVGAIWQPKAVVVDIATLTTLLEADAGFIALLDQPVPPAPQGHSHPNNLLPATTGHTVSSSVIVCRHTSPSLRMWIWDILCLALCLRRA